MEALILDISLLPSPTSNDYDRPEGNESFISSFSLMHYKVITSSLLDQSF